DLFVILWKHAQDEGVRVHEDRVETILVNSLGITRDTVSQDLHDFWASAIRHLLLVDGLYERLGSVAKVSDAAVQHQLAQMQQVKLHLVEFKPQDFEKKVAPPTTQ